MPETIALHTRLKPGAEDAYADAHANIPPELVTALKDAGVRNWRIWRSCLELFHLVEVDDYQAMRRALADHPANVPWQARMAKLLAVEDDYSGTDSGIPKVWELP
ncbi:L-rhamnose mutarotase [Arthrobacter cupressi]|uniref:L-rhamnose mutarotase n=1 Tax=Arthrobacter cupressi TaxID=1045773 RepID=A0A1G8X7Y2_9MICC|nr:L-rhamnose mutarotase [Arthrobacter cupressi]NYD77732.1 L-rhamnose mutarotase [Arthrobacter cupressi]SDJ86514.1 L-rhamnose mutarotase [Arthrobacter cupressi]